MQDPDVRLEVQPRQHTYTDQIQPHDAQSLQQHCSRDFPPFSRLAKADVVKLSPIMDPCGSHDLRHDGFQALIEGLLDIGKTKGQCLLPHKARWQTPFDARSDAAKPLEELFFQAPRFDFMVPLLADVALSRLTLVHHHKHRWSG